MGDEDWLPGDTRAFRGDKGAFQMGRKMAEVACFVNHPSTPMIVVTRAWIEQETGFSHKEDVIIGTLSAVREWVKRQEDK